jgi:hypothetical protein
MDKKWLPYYRQTGPVSFVVKDKLTGTTTKYHARQLRLADITLWPTPVNNDNARPMRKTNHVVPPADEESSEEEEIPESLEREIRHKQRERENSEDAEDIPLAEFQRRISAKKIIDQEETKTNSDSDETDDYYESDLEKRKFLVADEQSPKPEPLNDNMEIDNNDVTPVPSPRLRKKQPFSLPRTTLNEKEVLAESSLATMAKLLS